jgi:hypothetical protein
MTSEAITITSNENPNRRLQGADLLRQITSTSCWIGTAADCQSFREIFDLGIQAVVQLAAEEPALAAPRELLLFRFPILDSSGNDPVVLRLAIQTIGQLIAARIPALLSCSAGMSRSPAILAAALALTDRCSIDDCLKRVIGDGPSEVSPALWNEIRAQILQGKVVLYSS